MDLYHLSKVILSIKANGISKVRFAKIIYFVHKELIRINALTANDIKYIRMPLGPVPDGFMTLTVEHDDIIKKSSPSGLSYNSETYMLKRKFALLPKPKNELYVDIKKILLALDEVSTSDLIESSHHEPSWINHSNGQIFSITSKDLKNGLPVTKIGSNAFLENQKIQASLVKGMIEDIVNESTDLEYPTDGSR